MRSMRFTGRWGGGGVRSAQLSKMPIFPVVNYIVSGTNDNAAATANLFLLAACCSLLRQLKNAIAAVTDAECRDVDDNI